MTDTPGGHIWTCVLLGVMGVWMVIHGHEMAAAPLLGFFQVAAYAMRNTQKANGQTTTTVSETVVSTTPTPPIPKETL